MKPQVWFTSVNHPKNKVEYDNSIKRTIRYRVKEILFGGRIERQNAWNERQQRSRDFSTDLRAVNETVWLDG